MSDKQMNFVHSDGTFVPAFLDDFTTEIHISEADPDIGETANLTVRVSNNTGFDFGTVELTAVKTAGNPDVSVFGGTVSLALADNTTEERSWLVSNTGAGAINSPAFTTTVTVNPGGFASDFIFDIP